MAEGWSNHLYLTASALLDQQKWDTLFSLLESHYAILNVGADGRPNDRAETLAKRALMQLVKQAKNGNEEHFRTWMHAKWLPNAAKREYADEYISHCAREFNTKPGKITLQNAWNEFGQYAAPMDENLKKMLE